MAKYYFRDNNEDCYSIKAHLLYMQENHIIEMTVFEAERMTDIDFFYCLHYEETGEVGENCGIAECDYYKPNNGISGRCKHYGYVYEKTDKKKILKVKPIIKGKNDTNTKRSI